jgi:oligopeptide transport system permease protein
LTINHQPLTISPRATASAAILVLLLGASFLSPWIAPYAEEAQSLRDQYQPPSLRHWMGTDIKGRDVLSRVFYGGRVSFAVGFAATAVSLVIGVTYGAVAGYVGGRLDNLMMRFVDLLYGLPYMFLVILAMAIAGRNISPPYRLLVLFAALGAVQWLTMSRIVRGQVLSLKEREFVEAARALGAGPGRILFLHIVPNLLGPVIVYATLTVPSVMLQEAFLSFLGLGIQPPQASWGSLLADGAAVVNPVRIYWWLIVGPGAAIALTLFCLNTLGEGLRDALDPQARHQRG